MKDKTILKAAGFASAIVFAFVLGLIVQNHIAPIGLNPWGPVSAKSGLAIEGYDPVAYFAYDRAMKGEEKYSLHKNGKTWHFISEEHKLMFDAFPEKYSPEYGGYCANAISKGMVKNSNPEYWHRNGDKIYLFANREMREDFKAEITHGIIDSANEKWL